VPVERREQLRAKTTELMQRLRPNASVPQELWELLDVLAARLDRIELGAFDEPDEIPTRPDRKVSSGNLSAVVEQIFEEAKKKEEP
jgi:hypothetical protein